MKKILIVVIMIMILNVIAHAEVCPIIETNDAPITGLTYLCEDYYMFERDGNQYYIYRGDRTNLSMPVLYNEEEFNVFIKGFGADGYVKTNIGYMAWYNPLPHSIVFAGADSWKGYYGEVRFYDNDFTEIHKVEFYPYILSCEYSYNTYYCNVEKRTLGPTCFKSTDMINWEESISNIPEKIRTCNNIKYTSNKVSFDDGKTFKNVLFENENCAKAVNKLEMNLIVKNSMDYSYFSTDNIYYIDISYSGLGFPERAVGKTRYQPITVWYFTNDSFIMESRYENRIRIPLDELENELNKLKAAPYIKLNDKILGFSQPPIIENDRTLVPMRFLFEQMGAEVEWDNTTQTATATVPISPDTQMSTFNNAEEKSVTFSINDTTATVNGESATMDVPARLVNDKTMVPLRFLSENLGYNVEWDATTNTAIITTM